MPLADRCWGSDSPFELAVTCSKGDPDDKDSQVGSVDEDELWVGRAPVNLNNLLWHLDVFHEGARGHVPDLE